MITFKAQLYLQTSYVLTEHMSQSVYYIISLKNSRGRNRLPHSAGDQMRVIQTVGWIRGDNLVGAKWANSSVASWFWGKCMTGSLYIIVPILKKKKNVRASLSGQWLRLHLPIPGHGAKIPYISWPKKNLEAILQKIQ